MSYDQTLATPSERRAVLLLATMYDGGQRSVNCEEFGAAIGARGDEFENLISRMSEANLIRYRNVEGFSLTAMIVDAAERINRSPLDMAESVQKLAARSKAILLVFLLFAGVCGLLLFAARQILLDQPPPQLRAGVQQR